MDDTVEALRKLRRFAQAAAERNRRKGERLVAEVLGRKARVRKEFWEIGRALVQLADPAVYTAMGHQSFEELLDVRQLFVRSHAMRLVEVARTFSREQAVSLGLEKAFALARYVAATPRGGDRGQPRRRGRADRGEAAVGAIGTGDRRGYAGRASKGTIGEPGSAGEDGTERGARGAGGVEEDGGARRGREGSAARGAWVVQFEAPVEVIGVIGGR